MDSIEDLPYPAYDMVDMKKYIYNNTIKFSFKKSMLEVIKEKGIDKEKVNKPIYIYSKRGCPFGCTFCYRNFGRKVAYSSVDYTIKHIESLAEEFDSAHFIFGDELFNVDRKWVMEFCHKIIELDKKFLFATGNGLRANTTRYEDLLIMRQAGFYRAAVGIESFYDPTLIEMKKNQTADQIEEAINAVVKSGIEIGSTQLLFGYKSDGWDSMNETLRRLIKLKRYGAAFAIPCPYPGTYLYDQAVKEELITDEEGWLLELSDRDISDRIINMSGRSTEELQTIIQYGYDVLKSREIMDSHKKNIIYRPLLSFQLVTRIMFGLDLIELVRSVKYKYIKEKTQQLSSVDDEGINIVNETGTSGTDSQDHPMYIDAFNILDTVNTSIKHVCFDAPEPVEETSPLATPITIDMNMAPPVAKEIVLELK